MSVLFRAIPVVLALLGAAGLCGEGAAPTGQEDALKPWHFLERFAGTPWLAGRATMDESSLELQAWDPARQAVQRLFFEAFPQGLAFAAWGLREKDGNDLRFLTAGACADEEKAAALVTRHMPHVNKFGVFVKDEESGLHVMTEAQLAFGEKKGQFYFGTVEEVRHAWNAETPLLGLERDTPVWLKTLAPAVHLPDAGLTVRVMLNADPASPWWNGVREALLKVLGLRDAEPHALLVYRQARDGIRLRLAVPWQGKAAALGKLIFAADPASELSFHLPPRALGAMQGLWREQTVLLDVVADALGLWDADVRQEYLDELAEVDRYLGFSLRDDLLKHFVQGAGLAILARGKDGKSAISSALDWLVIAPTPNATEVVNILRKAILKNGGAWIKREENGQLVSSWRIGEETRAEFAEKASCLIAGSSLEAVAKIAENGPEELKTPVPSNFHPALMLQANLEESGAWLKKTRPAPAAEPSRGDIATQLLVEHGGRLRLATGRAGECVCVLLDWDGGNPSAFLGRLSREALLPWLGGLRADAKQQMSLSNARQLGKAIVMYADKNKGCAPTAWAELAGDYIVSGKWFLSPKREDQEDDPKVAAKRCDYHLIFPGQELRKLNQDLPLLYQKPNFDENGTVVGFVDGRAEYVDRQTLESLLTKAREAGGKP